MRSVAWVVLLCLAPVVHAVPLRILFVGNSLTYWEDVPTRVERLASSAGMVVTVDMLAAPDHSIEMHMKAHHLIPKLREGWDIVVMQQGPSSTAEGRAHLQRWGMRAATLVRKHGAVPVFYSPWPTRERARYIDAVYSNYSNAAISAETCVLPVTRAWLAGREVGLEDAFYHRDRQHASPAGAHLAAQVIAFGLLGVQGLEDDVSIALAPLVVAAYRDQDHACDAVRLRLRISGDNPS